MKPEIEGDGGMTKWKGMKSAPSGTSVLLFNKHKKAMCIGRKRRGRIYEPWEDEFEWRCDYSGFIFTPTHWAPKPQEPDQKEVAK